MRLVFICIGLGAIVWYLQSHLPVAPTALCGAVMICAAIGVRFCEQWRIPGAVGAISMGLALGGLHIVNEDHYPSIQPFLHLALAWVGLQLSTAMGRPLLVNRRLLGCACCFFFPPFVLSFSVLFFQPLPLGSAIQLAAVTGMAAPLFTPSREHPLGDTYPIALLTTGFGLVAWGISHALAEQAMPDRLSASIWALPVLLLAAEGFHRVFQYVRTDSGRAIGWILATLLIALFAWTHGISPLLPAFLFGFALSLRSRESAPFPARNPFSDIIAAFVIASVALPLALPGVPAPETIALPVLLACAATMCLGKLLGGGLARHRFSLPVTSWLPLMPCGLLGALCFSQTAPGIWADAAPAQTLFFLLSFGLLPLLVLWPLLTLIRKIKNGRRIQKKTRPAP